jgi:hypothetical protein
MMNNWLEEREGKGVKTSKRIRIMRGNGRETKHFAGGKSDVFNPIDAWTRIQNAGQTNEDR